MTKRTLQPVIQKDATIWSSRRACRIDVRISYRVTKERGCTIYRLKQVEELDKRAA